jgi:putative RecB family exonuclease
LVQEGEEVRGGGGNYTRSISQLKAYTRCGQAFYLERFRRSDLPSRPAPWTILGVAFHDSVMLWEKSERKIDLVAAFESEYDNIVTEEWLVQPDPRYWVLPPGSSNVQNSIKNYRERGIKQMATYYERCQSAPWEISHIERQFEIDLDGITVRGGVDRILCWPSDEFYAIEDIKTGNLKGEEDVRQLGFYAFVARELWDVPVSHGRYWFTKMDRGSEFVDLTKFDRKFWEKEFRLLDKVISEGIFLASPGENCGICSVRPWCNTMGTKRIGEPLGG